MHTESSLNPPTRSAPPQTDFGQAEPGHPDGWSDQYDVIRRNGKLTRFNVSKIEVAVTRAFLSVEGGTAAASSRVHETVEQLSREVMEALFRRLPDGGTVHIEDIQDQVELALMRNGHHKVARAYVLYREEHARLRAAASPDCEAQPDPPQIHLQQPDGSRRPLDIGQLEQVIAEACSGLKDVSAERVLEEVLRSVYDGMPAAEIGPALTLSARVLIEQDPDYSLVAAHLLLDALRREVSLGLPGEEETAGLPEFYRERFPDLVHRAVGLELLDPVLGGYDLERLARALRPERDRQFTYLGLQTLYDRYFIHNAERRLELPQTFFMRVAMGLAIHEIDREARAIEFYDLLSSFDFMSSTPTLFNSGTLRPQLSSCYLTTVPDELGGIYSAIRDNALLSKFAGGLGNDWTRVRGLGAHIRGTNGDHFQYLRRFPVDRTGLPEPVCEIQPVR